MIGDAPEDRDLQALGPTARRAVAAAEEEALALGHDRIGTEHLLLGLLGDESSAAARMLGKAGVRLSLARRKVGEALPASSQVARGEAPPLELTTRAARAVGRAVRLSNERRAEMVTTEHLLVGLLHVEGTAGQVLRSLGLDVERLSAAIDAGDVRQRDDGPRVGEVEAPGPKPLSCPSCRAAVGDDLVFRVVRARGETGPRDVGLVACRRCGTVIGVIPV